MSEEFCRERSAIMALCGSPLIRVSFVATDQWALQFKRRIWKTCPDTILRSLVAKIKRNLKMTVLQEVGIDSNLLNQM